MMLVSLSHCFTVSLSSNPPNPFSHRNRFIAVHVCYLQPTPFPFSPPPAHLQPTPFPFPPPPSHSHLHSCHTLNHEGKLQPSIFPASSPNAVAEDSFAWGIGPHSIWRRNANTIYFCRRGCTRSQAQNDKEGVQQSAAAAAFAVAADASTINVKVLIGLIPDHGTSEANTPHFRFRNWR